MLSRRSNSPEAQTVFFGAPWNTHIICILKYVVLPVLLALFVLEKIPFGIPYRSVLPLRH